MPTKSRWDLIQRLKC